MIRKMIRKLKPQFFFIFTVQNKVKKQKKKREKANEKVLAPPPPPSTMLNHLSFNGTLSGTTYTAIRHDDTTIRLSIKRLLYDTIEHKTIFIRYDWARKKFATLPLSILNYIIRYVLYFTYTITVKTATAVDSTFVFCCFFFCHEAHRNVQVWMSRAIGPALSPSPRSEPVRFTGVGARKYLTGTGDDHRFVFHENLLSFSVALCLSSLPPRPPLARSVVGTILRPSSPSARRWCNLHIKCF